MKKIKELVDWIDDELEGAKCYAEKYVYKKAKGSQWANRFHSMAEDELNHAEVIHQLAMEEIEELNKVFQAPVEMEEAWKKSHKEYVEKAAWVRQMLAM